MTKLTELEISRINNINTHTQKIELGNIIQNLILENESMTASLDTLNQNSKKKQVTNP